MSVWSHYFDGPLTGPNFRGRLFRCPGLKSFCFLRVRSSQRLNGAHAGGASFLEDANGHSAGEVYLRGTMVF